MKPSRLNPIHTSRRALSTADLLFSRLDKQRIRGRAATWMTEILGVFVEGREAWVQVAAAGHPTTSIVVRMSLQSSVDRVIAALKAWSDFPLGSRPGGVLDARA
jgi:hypothetical protein